MVDQAEVTKVNGRTELPPREMARNTAEFLSDVATLAELQGKLVVVDLREGTTKLVGSAVLLILGTVVAIGCVPVALTALALVLYEFAHLSASASFGIALLSGIVLAAVLSIPAAVAIKKDFWMFERSRGEWRRNMQWLRDTMKRLGSQPSTPPSRSPRW